MINFRRVGDLQDVYRSGNANAITHDFALHLVNDLRIRRYFDLRTDVEIASVGLPRSLIDVGIDWCHIPVTSPASNEILGVSPSAAEYAAYYRAILDSNPDAICDVLSAINDTLPNRVAFGCHAGKDRTGIVAAALLEVCGFDKQAIAEDYTASRPFLEKSIDQFAVHWQKKGLTRDEYRSRFASHAETIELFYESLHANSIALHLQHICKSEIHTNKLIRLLK